MFESGERVLCIEEDEGPGGAVLTVGNVYTVKQIWPYALDPDTYATVDMVIVTLFEVEAGRDKYGRPLAFDAACFRRLDDPAIDIFRKMTKEIDIPAMIWGA